MRIRFNPPVSELPAQNPARYLSSGNTESPHPPHSMGTCPECMPHVTEKRAQSNTFDAELRVLSGHTSSATEALGKGDPTCLQQCNQYRRIKQNSCLPRRQSCLRNLGKGGAEWRQPVRFLHCHRGRVDRQPPPMNVCGSVMAPKFRTFRVPCIPEVRHGARKRRLGS